MTTGLSIVILHKCDGVVSGILTIVHYDEVSARNLCKLLIFIKFGSPLPPASRATFTGVFVRDGIVRSAKERE
jgi:hypothetical protein